VFEYHRKASFHSREWIESYSPRTDEALISIRDPGKELARIKSGWHDVLFLAFHDIDAKDDGREVRSFGEPYILQAMRREQAQDVLNFVRRNHDRRIYVNCEAGISRSAGVVAWLVENWGYKSPERGLPNIHVLSLLRRVEREERPSLRPEDYEFLF